jgi:UDP-N-acetylglucosamine 2-epimerase (non-hydrolysing)
MIKAKKVLVVLGTRPEAIKLAPLIHQMHSKPNSFKLKVCVTGQHREMLDQVLELFEISPDFDLNVMKPGQSLSELTGDILRNVNNLLLGSAFDILLVHGDTTTALASALSGFYNNVAVGHVEAGLRTGDVHSPFPEEFNRQTISKIASWHFAPTKVSQNNLISEGIHSKDIYVTGNSVIDALYWVLNKVSSDSRRQNMLNEKLVEVLSFDFKRERFILVTGHRRENFGNGIASICNALKDIALAFPSVFIVYPVHLNPQINNPVRRILGGVPNIKLINPLDYEAFVYLMQHCYFVLTDSGGIQEEAPSLGKPVLLMRKNTERPEAVEAGTVELVGASKAGIIDGVSKLLLDAEHYDLLSEANSPYGDGTASSQVISALLKS